MGHSWFLALPALTKATVVVHRRIKESQHGSGVRLFSAITLVAASCAFVASVGSDDSATTPKQVFDIAYTEPAPTTTQVISEGTNPEQVAPVPLKRNAELSDLSVQAKSITQELGKCGDDSSCSAAILVKHKDEVQDVISAFSYVISQGGKLASSCHEPSHQLGAILTPSLLAGVSYASVCTDGLLHGSFETWGATKTLADASSQVLALCKPLGAHSCAHVAGHALYRAAPDYNVALKECRAIQVFTEGCANGVMMLVFEDLRAKNPRPSLQQIAEVCSVLEEETKPVCEEELPWQWTLSGLGWEETISGCVNVSKEGRSPCARGAGRIAYAGGDYTPDETYERCSKGLDKSIVTWCIASAAHEVGQNSLNPNPDVICAAARDYKKECVSLQVFWGSSPVVKQDS